jgi:hypothetical protein
MVYRKSHEALVIITKTYDLILWSCNHTGKFLRNHRFVLGERIERNRYDLRETLIGAKYSRQRQPLLEKVNLILEILRFQMRLAKAGRPRGSNNTPPGLFSACASGGGERAFWCAFADHLTYGSPPARDYDVSNMLLI